ncbi:MAG: radical SAM protein [Lentisphaeraceae bacterium]|nr:radical SAM protein [Lentisphaeraceae bacterium]
MNKDSQKYSKHHSFSTFFSRLEIDPEKQTQRAIKALKSWLQKNECEIRTKALLSLEAKDHKFKITQFIADELSLLNDEELCRYIFHRYRYDVYPKEKTLDKYPPYLQIEPSSTCNYRCVFCYQSDESFTNKSAGYMGSMTYELFKEIVDQSVGNIEFASIASRGEPLIARDIDKMLEYCRGKFLGFKLNTNASLLNEKKIHGILSGGIRTVVFSADAANDEDYANFRVNGSLQRVLKNIRLFNEIKEKHYSDLNLITRVSGVFVDEKKQSLQKMIGVWGDLVDQVSFVKYNPWENVYDSPKSNVSEPCSDLWRRMFIWFDGKANPCDTDYKSSLCVGNIIDKSLSELWCSDIYEQLRASHLSGARKQQKPCNQCVVI